jgi:hypothetical protein
MISEMIACLPLSSTSSVILLYFSSVAAFCSSYPGVFRKVSQYMDKFCIVTLVRVQHEIVLQNGITRIIGIVWAARHELMSVLSRFAIDKLGRMFIPAGLC